MPTFSHHRITTRAPGDLSNPSNRSSSDLVAMYYSTVFCHSQMYSSIVWNPASSLAVAAEVYSHFLSFFCHGSLPVSRSSTWS